MSLFKWLIKRPWRYTTAIVVVVPMVIFVLGWLSHPGLALIFGTPIAVVFGNMIHLVCGDLHAEWIAYGPHNTSDVEYVLQATKKPSQF